MRIKIRAFGIARDILGNSYSELDLDKTADIAGLKDTLTERYPKFSQLASLSIAVNMEYQQDDFRLNEQDEIVIIPPVAGG